MGIFKRKNNKNAKNSVKENKVNKKNKDTKQDKKTTKVDSKTKPNRNVPWGRTITTNDKYLGKQKTGSNKKRPVVVIDNNKNNELAVVPLSSKSGSNRTELKGYKNKKTGQTTYYKHYIEIEDDEGNPIVINDKFRENHKNMDISREDVDSIRDRVLNHSLPSKSNKEKIQKLHKKNRD